MTVLCLYTVVFIELESLWSHKLKSYTFSEEILIIS